MALAEQELNVAPFGQNMSWDGAGRDFGVMWEDARDVFRVVVKFAGDTAVAPESIHLQYWQSAWPERRIPRDSLSGSGGSGWLDVGDWYQGKWVTSDARVDVRAETCTWTFNPVNAEEFPQLRDFNAPYRTTFKLRIVSDRPLPAIESFAAYTDSTMQPLEFAVEWGGNSGDSPQVWDGRLEIFNGIIEQITALGPEVTPAKGNDLQGGWRSRVSNGKAAGISARVLCAQPKSVNSFDGTIVTVRADQKTFSFAAADLIKYGHIFIPDLGVLVKKVGQRITYKSADDEWRKARADQRTMDLYSRVSRMPEQTFTRAWQDTPAKQPHYIPLSFEGSRQHFGLDEHGNVFCLKNWISRLHGRDTEKCLWNGDQITYRFGLPQGPPKNRGLVDGCLPMVVAEWTAEGIHYRQTAFAIPLAGVPKPSERIHADDPLVLMIRFEMEAAGDLGGEARLVFSAQDTKRNPLAIDGDLAVAQRGQSPVSRMRLVSADPPGKYTLTESDGSLVYKATLSATDRRRTVDAVIPFVTLQGQDLSRLRELTYAKSFDDVREYWHKRLAAGTRITTPEPMINDFYNAHVSHLLINTEREIGDSNLYMPKVGTFNYGVYANESCMMVSDLDRRGYHDRAEQALETWLHYQGTVGLPGDFSTKDGVLYGAGGYEAGGYNQHHGWVLWCLGEHYWYTRNAAWLNRVAPNVVKGCQWIINERHRSTEQAKHFAIRAIERGLLPPGRLEDIGDWRCWLSTNAYNWWGMQNAARALVDINHPEAKRLLAEADAYRKDLLSAYTEAMRRSPVVRLRDGSWIPHVPSDVHRRGRSFGWITETLEGAIHLVRCGLVAPDDRLATWIIKDYEDNLYLSQQFGYELQGAEFERRWFSHGGISQQANLLHNPIAYLLRDEPRHFLRAYFNAFAVSYFPDTRMMTEHALPNIGDWRGDHYKSSDEANSTYWLRLMFVQERGDELWLGSAIPRYWLADGREIGIDNASTYFGAMSVQMKSAAASGRIEMAIDPPKRNPPRLLRARFRHPDGLRMVRCEVNGKPHDRFDPEKEWVELAKWDGPIHISAFYGTPPTVNNKESPEAREQRLAWWREARFGLFVHWGPVSLKGTEIGWSRSRQIPAAVYDNLYKEFNPDKFDAKQWVSTAKKAGMKYVGITSKHHDGFCLWNSKQTNYDIMSTPFARDVIRELAEECRRQGLRFCVYYSICDWRHPDYPLGEAPGGGKKQNPNMDHYVAYMKAQLKELLSNYGPLGILWFDGEWEEPWTHQRGLELYQYCRSLQADLIINNRVDTGRDGMKGRTKGGQYLGDYDTPEQEIGRFQRERPWETCMTIATQWAWKPDDRLKPLKECIESLVRCAGGDGNLLLNVGPMPDGRIEPRQVERLNEIGRWMEQFGEGIYGTRGGPFKPAAWGASTCKGNVIYVHILNWTGDELQLPPIDARIVESSLIAGGTPDVKQDASGIRIAVSREHRQSIDTVVKLRLDIATAGIEPRELSAGGGQ
jgi:alpha-L-fucosidase